MNYTPFQITVRWFLMRCLGFASNLLCSDIFYAGASIPGACVYIVGSLMLANYICVAAPPKNKLLPALNNVATFQLQFMVFLLKSPEWVFDFSKCLFHFWAALSIHGSIYCN